MALIVAVLDSIGVVLGGAPLPGLSTSENGRHSVEVSNAPENQIVVNVFELSKQGKTLKWSRAIDWQLHFPQNPMSVASQVKALVTNDGKTAILRDLGVPEQKNGVAIVRDLKGNQHTLRPFERRELTGAQLSQAQLGEPRMRAGVSYAVLNALIDLILDDNRHYAMWFGQADRWLLISLDDSKETVVEDVEMLAKLNTIARRKAEALVREHQPSGLRLLFRDIRAQAAKVLPAVGPPFRSQYITPETQAAYLFLTTRKDSADLRYIEGLVNFPAHGIQPALLVGWPSHTFDFEAPRERLFGDFLLSRWNGETNREVLARDRYLLIPHDSFRHLGTIKIDFLFPMTVPAKNGGTLWAYLIPAAAPKGQWVNSSQLLTFNTRLDSSSPGFPQRTPIGPNAQAFIRGITPGDYRLKMIWERHPLAGVWRTNAYAAIPGDYETDESPSITVTAGGTASIARVACTNRLGNAKAYEADDHLLKNTSPKENSSEP